MCQLKPTAVCVEPDREELRPGLRPPRFSLFTFLASVAVLGVLFATMTYIGLYAALGLVFFLLTIAAHVAGNALGTQLRDNANSPVVVRPRQPKQEVSASEFAPTTQLHHRSALGIPILITTLLGAIVAAAIGGYGLSTLMERPTIQTVSYGVVACFVLGAIWTFAASSFLQVASGAWRQAVREPKK